MVVDGRRQLDDTLFGPPAFVNLDSPAPATRCERDVALAPVFHET
jgi:hypothetical protein